MIGMVLLLELLCVIIWIYVCLKWLCSKSENKIHMRIGTAYLLFGVGISMKLDDFPSPFSCITHERLDYGLPPEYVDLIRASVVPLRTKMCKGSMFNEHDDMYEQFNKHVPSGAGDHLENIKLYGYNEAVIKHLDLICSTNTSVFDRHINQFVKSSYRTQTDQQLEHMYEVFMSGSMTYWKHCGETEEYMLSTFPLIKQYISGREEGKALYEKRKLITGNVITHRTGHKQDLEGKGFAITTGKDRMELFFGRKKDSCSIYDQLRNQCDLKIENRGTNIEYGLEIDSKFFKTIFGSFKDVSTVKFLRFLFFGSSKYPIKEYRKIAWPIWLECLLMTLFGTNITLFTLIMILGMIYHLLFSSISISIITPLMFIRVMKFILYSKMNNNRGAIYGSEFGMKTFLFYLIFYGLENDSYLIVIGASLFHFLIFIIQLTWIDERDKKMSFSMTIVHNVEALICVTTLFNEIGDVKYYSLTGSIISVFTLPFKIFTFDLEGIEEIIKKISALIVGYSFVYADEFKYSDLTDLYEMWIFILAILSLIIFLLPFLGIGLLIVMSKDEKYSKYSYFQIILLGIIWIGSLDATYKRGLEAFGVNLLYYIRIVVFLTNVKIGGIYFIISRFCIFMLNKDLEKYMPKGEVSLVDELQAMSHLISEHCRKSTVKILGNGHGHAVVTAGNKILTVGHVANVIGTEGDKREYENIQRQEIEIEYHKEMSQFNKLIDGHNIETEKLSVAEHEKLKELDKLKRELRSSKTVYVKHRTDLSEMRKEERKESTQYRKEAITRLERYIDDELRTQTQIQKEIDVCHMEMSEIKDEKFKHRQRQPRRPKRKPLIEEKENVCKMSLYNGDIIFRKIKSIKTLKENIYDRIVEIEFLDDLPPEVGVANIGAPSSINYLYTTEGFSPLMKLVFEKGMVKHKTNTAPGDSGSPYFNLLGEVIALHFGGSRRGNLGINTVKERFIGTSLDGIKTNELALEEFNCLPSFTTACELVKSEIKNKISRN